MSFFHSTLPLLFITTLVTIVASACSAPSYLIAPKTLTQRQLLVAQAWETAKKHHHLPYKFGGASPKDGGFDCSGATSYLMTNVGMKPPRTSAQQYIWLRDNKKIHKISPSVSKVSDPAFKNLKVGDLLFWSGTYVPTDGRTVKITHVGIYMGIDKDGKHIMACSSSGRSYKGKKGNGFGIYDFKLPSKSSKSKFVGYGSPPFNR